MAQGERVSLAWRRSRVQIPPAPPLGVLRTTGAVLAGRGSARPRACVCAALIARLPPAGEGPTVIGHAPVWAVALFCLGPRLACAQLSNEPMRVTVVGLNREVSSICLEYPVATSTSQVETDVAEMVRLGGWTVGPLLLLGTAAPAAWRIEARPGVATDSEGKPPIWPIVSALRRFDCLSVIFVHGVEGDVRGRPVSNLFMSIEWEAYGGATYYKVGIKDRSFRGIEDLPRAPQTAPRTQAPTPAAVWSLLAIAAAAGGLLVAFGWWRLQQGQPAVEVAAGQLGLDGEGKDGAVPEQSAGTDRQPVVVPTAKTTEEGLP